MEDTYDNGKEQMLNYLIIGAGGFLGAVTRYLVATWIGQKWGRIFPFGTFAVNISGSFFIGLIMSLFVGKFMVNPQWRLFLVIGFIGSYTTFSTFEYETGGLLQDGEFLLATMNIFLSVFLGFVGLKIGEMIARAI